MGLAVKVRFGRGASAFQGPSMLGVVENKFEWNILIGKFARMVRLLIYFRRGSPRYF